MTIENNGISLTNDNKFSAPRPENVKPSCVVITYSVSETLNDTIAVLQKKGASVHYVIDTDGKQYQYHNDLTDKAFYAGKSSWKGKESVNDFGIGIMFINDAESGFTPEQIATAKNLLGDISARYPDLDIKHDLVGLGEVAEKHIAPGKYFPWKDLADAGFGQFPSRNQEGMSEEQMKELATKIMVKKDDKDDPIGYVSRMQAQLKNHGYDIKVTGECDDSTIKWFTKFNERYIPEQSPPDNWTEASQWVYLNLHPEDISLSGLHITPVNL